MISRLIGRHRSFSTNQKNLNYIDKWFESIVKPQTFYDEHGNSPSSVRRYFYNVDLNGRLFLEETLPKNIASSIKDEKFLNFFFSRIRLANSEEKQFLETFGFTDDYPFVSPCGKEINYVRPACTPIVYQSIINKTLTYGGNLTQSFQHSDLAICKNTGRLYHKLPARFRDRAKREESNKNVTCTALEYGLLRSSVAIALSDIILPATEDCEQWKLLTSEGTEDIDWLPEESEASVWAMPFSESKL